MTDSEKIARIYSYLETYEFFVTCVLVVLVGLGVIVFISHLLGGPEWDNND